MIKELSSPTSVSFPGRWTLGELTDEQTVIEIENLSRIIVQGCEAISGVYMRLVGRIRECSLPDWKIRRELGKHFPQPRVSEIMRVARAPQDVYLKYSAGFFGFKSALKQCRYYHTSPTQMLLERQARRAAERLIALLGDTGRIRVKGRLVIIAEAG